MAYMFTVVEQDASTLRVGIEDKKFNESASVDITYDELPNNEVQFKKFLQAIKDVLSEEMDNKSK